MLVMTHSKGKWKFNGNTLLVSNCLIAVTCVNVYVKYWLNVCMKTALVKVQEVWSVRGNEKANCGPKQKTKYVLCMTRK
jgi:hypothetical protein